MRKNTENYGKYGELRKNMENEMHIFQCFSVFFRTGHIDFPCFSVFFCILRTYAFDFPYFSDIFRIVPGVMTMDVF